VVEQGQLAGIVSITIIEHVRGMSGELMNPVALLPG